MNFCLGANSQHGEETPQALSIQEGENVTMNCSYKGTITNLQWYRQDSGGGPALLILIRSNEREKGSGRLRVTLDTPSTSSSLHIAASQVADTAAFFCAIDAQCSADTCDHDANPESHFLQDLTVGGAGGYMSVYCGWEMRALSHV